MITPTLNQRSQRHMALMLALGISLTASIKLQAQTTVPAFISYQGQVLDNTGAPVGVGTPVNRTVVFRIWDSPSGSTDANLIYSEAQTVTISNGEFSVLVGQGVATIVDQYGFGEAPKSPPNLSVANAFNGAARYLGVTIDDGTEAVDNEVAPRQQIVSSAFAFRAKEAESITNGSLQGGTLTGTINTSGATFSGGTFNNALFNTLNTGQGATELYLMNQNVRTSDAVSFSTINTGQGSTELHLMNQNVRTTDDVTFASVNTGAGGTELYPMNQGVRTSDSPTFASPSFTNAYTRGLDGGYHLMDTSNTEFGALGWSYYAGSYSSSATYGDVTLRAKSARLHLQSGTGAAAMTISNNNRVGIGTTNPGYPLEVAGSQVVNWSGRLFDINGTAGSQLSINLQTTIKAANCVVAQNFFAFSDARIKQSAGQSDSANDLTLLNRVKVTDYTYIDKLGMGSSSQKKVIAQELEEVLPQAVSKIVNFIPSVYAAAESVEKKGGDLRLTLAKEHKLNVGDTVRWYDEEDGMHEVAVSQVLSEFAFSVPFEGVAEKAFVYGKRVDDFRTVDYETVAMLNVSATQELAQKVAKLESESAKKDEAVAEMKIRIADLEAKDKARDGKISAIEKMLSGDRPETVTVSLKPAAAN